MDFPKVGGGVVMYQLVPICKKLIAEKLAEKLVCTVIFLLGIILLSVLPLQADNNTTTATTKILTADISTPYKAIYTHLYFLQEENFSPTIAAQTVYAPRLSEQERAEIAIQLKRYLDAKGLFVALEDIPTSADYTDPKTGKQRYYLFSSEPLIYVEKTDSLSWQYSSLTAYKTPFLYQSLFPLGTSALIEIFPEAEKTVLGLYWWQIIFLTVIVFVGFVVYKVLTWLFRSVLGRVLRKFGKADIADSFLIPVARQISLLTIFLIIPFFIPSLQFSVELTTALLNSAYALASFFAVFIVYRFTDVISAYLYALAQRTQNTLDDQLVPLFRKASKVSVVVIGGIFILQNLDFNVTALLTGVSIGGAALAFASQDTIKNLFGSVMIFADRPFQVGDWVVVKGLEGTVEEVGFRSTRIRTFYDSVICIPNGDLATSAIDNMGARRFRRYRASLSVTYDSSPESISAFVEGIYDIVAAHPQTRKDVLHIRLNEFGEFSLKILLYIFFDVPDWQAELRVREEIMLEILRLAEKLNIRFAFPTQTVHVESTPDNKPISQVSLRDKSQLQALKAQFLADYQARVIPPEATVVKNINSGGDTYADNR